MKCVHRRTEYNVDPRQCAAQGECHYKNRPIDGSPSDGLSNSDVGRALIWGTQLIYLLYLRH